tara:strand:- start:63 stop:437 length:375 start_codon:yes stop_codon:yes gene_type:complete
MKSIINITNNAWTKMSLICKKSKNNNFLFSVTSGGCNGFNFNFNLLKEEDYYNIIKKKSSVISNNKINVYIEPISEMYLIGTTIDYIEEDISNGVFESKFVYKIDRTIASSCGCGVSFMPKKIN